MSHNWQLSVNHFDMTRDDTQNDETPGLCIDTDIDKQSCNDSEDSCGESEMEADYLANLVTPKKLNSHSRAAPFYSEFAPGWRARAKLLAPPFSRNASIQLCQMAEPEDLAEDDVSDPGQWR